MYTKLSATDSQIFNCKSSDVISQISCSFLNYNLRKFIVYNFRQSVNLWLNSWFQRFESVADRIREFSANFLTSKLTYSFVYTTAAKNYIKYLCEHSIAASDLRYFIEFAYNGTQYHGWQLQPNAPTVQQALEKALSVLLGEKIETIGAGRTDAGVHAKQMFAHFDSDAFFEIPHLIHKLNSYLPKDIAVADIIPVHDDAHARFDAKKRTYEYHIHCKKDVFVQDLSWHYHNELDVPLMNIAANSLMRHTDFECFSKVNTDVNTFLCSVSQAHWEHRGTSLVFTISADRFLRNMVRAIVGTLINIGTHKIDQTEFTAIIESKDRSKAGASVPAHGLFLTKIEYDYIK